MTKRKNTEDAATKKPKKTSETAALRDEPVSSPAPYKNGTHASIPANDEGDGDAYEEDDDDEGEEFGGVTSQDHNINNDTQDRERLKLLLAKLSEEQMNRYEAFRRANLNRTGIKKLANAVLNQSITANVAVTLSGLAKVFVGELVEKAREVEQQMDREFLAQATKKRKLEDGTEEIGGEEETQPPLLALRPEHMREAWRLYRKEMGTVPNAHWRRQGGEGDGRFFR